MDRNEKFVVKSYNTKELANQYRITPKALRRWLTSLKPELGTRIGNYYSAEQVKIIIERFGSPES